MTTEATPATSADDLRARSWHARREAMLAELAEAEALVENLPNEAAQAHEELEDAKKVLAAAQESHDAARGKFEQLGEQVRESKRKVLALTSELQAHEAHRPIEKEI